MPLMVELRIVTAAVVLIRTEGVLWSVDCQHPVYVPPVVSYPETTYVPYTSPGPSLNFTIPLR